MNARPDSATQRYDRQLRLWAPSGQAALENAHVLILGASALAAQCAKNLVLPGVGAITIADARVVSDADAGANFFLAESSIGKHAAPEVSRLLSEMNPAVQCSGLVEEPQRLVADVSFIARHALVIAARQLPAVVDAAARACTAAEPPVPLLVTDSSGFTGALSLCIPEQCRTSLLTVVETHPESLVDLRLTRPFPALDAYVDSFDLHALDSHELSHVPYVVILRKALASCGKPERAAVRAAIDAMRHGADQENFDQAAAALGQHVWRPLGTPAVPGNVQQVLELVPQRPVDARFIQRYGRRTARFWALAAALARFVASAGGLPLPGSVPDMKAESKQYVALQLVYRTKAGHDADALGKLLDDVLAEAHLTRQDVAVDDDAVRTFARHARFLQVIPERPWHDRIAAPHVDAISAALDDPVNPPTVHHYLAYVAAREFERRHGRFPGESDSVDDDSVVLTKLCAAYATSVGLATGDGRLIGRACAEMCVTRLTRARGAHSDHPPTAALVGGIVAQEAVKLITAQYIPASNTCIYDGIAQAIGSFVI